MENRAYLGGFHFRCAKIVKHPKYARFPFLAQSKKRTTSLRSIRIAPARPFRAVLPRAPSSARSFAHASRISTLQLELCSLTAKTAKNPSQTAKKARLQPNAAVWLGFAVCFLGCCSQNRNPTNARDSAMKGASIVCAKASIVSVQKNVYRE